MHKLCNQIYSYLQCLLAPDFNHLMLFSVTWILGWGHKVSTKQNLLALFSFTLFNWSGWNLTWCWSSGPVQSWSTSLPQAIKKVLSTQLRWAYMGISHSKASLGLISGTLPCFDHKISHLKFNMVVLCSAGYFKAVLSDTKVSIGWRKNQNYSFSSSSSSSSAIGSRAGQIFSLVVATDPAVW